MIFVIILKIAARVILVFTPSLKALDQVYVPTVLDIL